MSNIDETTELRVAEIQPPLAAKKPRARPHVWARFYQVETGKTFFVGNDKAIKVSPFGFRRYARPACFVNDWGKQSRFEFIAPWRRVKTDVLVRDARLGGKSSVGDGVTNTFPYVRPAPFVFKDVDPLPCTHLSREIVDGLNAPSLHQTGPSA